MTAIDQLYEAFVAEHRAGGEADPREFLRRVAGADRQKLAERIDAYLDDAPPPAWDEARFSALMADERMQELAARTSEALTDLLDMANRAELMPSEVAERLAQSLGVPEHSGPMWRRYHELQSGLVPLERVSAKVFDALAAIFGTTRERVRAAAERAADSAVGGGDVVYARAASSAPLSRELIFEASVAPEEPGLVEVDAVFFDGP